MADDKTPQVSPTSPDVERLREWILAKIRACSFVDLVTAIITLVVCMRDLNNELARKLVELRRRRPLSETLARIERQLPLIFGPAVAAAPAPAAPPPNADAGGEEKPKRKHGGGRKRPPLDLPRVIVENMVPEAQRICPQCGSPMKTVGYSRCEKLELRPAEIFVEERRDERVAFPHDDTIVSAPTPPEIVERGALGSVLIVEAACDKFLEHLPIERQSRRWLRSRVHLSPRTLGRAVCALLDLLEPVANAIHDETRTAAHLATDATGLPVLDPEHPDHIRTASVWVWIGDERWVSFVYATDGTDQHPKAFLGEQRGRVVQCDGTPTLNFVERNGGIRPGCWAHARRRFVKAARAADTTALEAVRIIAKLFAIEHASDKLGNDAAARGKYRREHAPLILHELRQWLDAERGRTRLPPSPMAAARPVSRRWGSLITVHRYGRLLGASRGGARRGHLQSDARVGCRAIPCKPIVQSKEASRSQTPCSLPAS